MRIDEISCTRPVTPRVVRTVEIAGHNNGSDKGIKQIDEKPMQGEKKPLLDEDVLQKAVEEANKAVEDYDRRFEFSIHEKTKSIMVKVINTQTNEIIREIPPEKILDMIAKLWEMAGIIVDERV
ncbi:MAG: flagellar protein FlaG [Xylanivirga thermophila]|uniref:flagellar protein FlaG n=1 Tax=Xylanivirga thermophila TaxID=2496273 RepID=UPI00101DE569|nr:flagellar protein FlaG [Xylanivirga thermophila]